MGHTAALDVVTFGECMALFRAETPGPLHTVERFARSIAGADSNVAIGLARLGFRVAYHSRVGDDAFGRHILAALTAEGIDCHGMAVDSAHPTGFQIKARRDDGADPAVEYFRRGSAASRLSRADLPGERLAGARHLHVTGIPPALGEIATAACHHAIDVVHAAGGTVSFDPNLRPTLWPDEAYMIATVEALAARADWVLAGVDEARLLTGHDTPEAIAAHYRDAGVAEVAIKHGADGAWWASAAGAGHAPACRLARVIDTVGAGDGFAVGYISARLDGQPAATAAARGNAVGARVCCYPGDFEGLPRRPELFAATPMLDDVNPAPA